MGFRETINTGTTPRRCSWCWTT